MSRERVISRWTGGCDGEGWEGGGYESLSFCTRHTHARTHTMHVLPSIQGPASFVATGGVGGSGSSAPSKECGLFQPSPHPPPSAFFLSPLLCRILAPNPPQPLGVIPQPLGVILRGAHVVYLYVCISTTTALHREHHAVLPDTIVDIWLSYDEVASALKSGHRVVSSFGPRSAAAVRRLVVRYSLLFVRRGRTSG